MSREFKACAVCGCSFGVESGTEQPKVCCVCVSIIMSGQQPMVQLVQASARRS